MRRSEGVGLATCISLQMRGHPNKAGPMLVILQGRIGPSQDCGLVAFPKEYGYESALIG